MRFVISHSRKKISTAAVTQTSSSIFQLIPLHSPNLEIYKKGGGHAQFLNKNLKF
jgi:hypothetical protein